MLSMEKFYIENIVNISFLQFLNIDQINMKNGTITHNKIKNILDAENHILSPF